MITGFQKYRQRKGKLGKALTSNGYNPSRICWDFSLLNSDINLSLVGKYTEIETVLFTDIWFNIGFNIGLDIWFNIWV